MSDPQSPPRPHKALPAFAPVPRLKDRSNGWKPEVQRAFIEALADTGSVAAACRMVRRSTHGAYHLRRQPGAEEFAQAWQVALDIGMQRIEDVAMDRALNGVEQPVYSYGKLIGTRMVHNDRLLMFMLRNRASERFAEGRGAKGPGSLDAIGKMELEREKKKWLKEWEAERAATANSRKAETIERLSAKISKMQERRINAMSPRTRAAWDAFEASEQADKAADYKWWEDPDHPMNQNVRREAGEEEPMALPPPGWRESKDDGDDADEPRIRKLTDLWW